MPKSYTTPSFISKAKLKHCTQDGKPIYSYSKTRYVQWDVLITVTCKLHGDFKIVPAQHLSGRKCPQCARESLLKGISDSVDTYVAKARKVWGDMFDYSLVTPDENGVLPDYIPIRCKKHDYLFSQRKTEHINKDRHGKYRHMCPVCKLQSENSKVNFIKRTRGNPVNIYTVRLVKDGKAFSFIGATTILVSTKLKPLHDEYIVWITEVIPNCKAEEAWDIMAEMRNKLRVGKGEYARIYPLGFVEIFTEEQS